MEFLPVKGIRIGVARAGMRYPERRDLVVVEIAEGSQGVAVFTRNAFCAAPVTVAKAHLDVAMPRYLAINTGNANAGTGPGGIEDAEATCAAVADLTGCRSHEVLPFSTGVIGEPLPLDRLVAGLPAALADLRPEGWLEGAWGIMTTDTRPKIASRRVSIGGHDVAVTGIAKGAGMIRPDMATMLAFVATDADVAPLSLRNCLEVAVAKSFNAITVDGDTSTNDACVLLATGCSGVWVGADDEGFVALREAIDAVCIELAQGLVRDGEGATKFITVQVEQGRDLAECREVAYTIAHSPLVKTAFFAADPNWGRILAAIGRSGLEALRLDGVDVYMDEVCIVRNGERAADYTEARGQEVMDRKEITVRVRLRRGEASTCVWTSDLSFDYVRINAEYRT